MSDAAGKDEAGDTPLPTGETIVVGIDGSAGAQRALDWAILHATPGAEVQVIHTWNRPAMVSEAAVSIDPMIFADAADKALEGELERVRSTFSDLPALSGRTICGHAGACLLDAAKDADLLVVGTRGRGGFVGLLLGSTSTYLAHHATCPLVIVPGGDRNP